MDTSSFSNGSMKFKALLSLSLTPFKSYENTFFPSSAKVFPLLYVRQYGSQTFLIKSVYVLQSQNNAAFYLVYCRNKAFSQNPYVRFRYFISYNIAVEAVLSPPSLSSSLNKACLIAYNSLTYFLHFQSPNSPAY